MSDNKPKFELPSVTKKKQEDWNEMDGLYNECYNSLTTTVAAVGTIVNMKNSLPPSVDENKLTVMVSGLNKNINSLRTQLNDIHGEVQRTKDMDMDIMDINMECIQIASQYNQWRTSFVSLCQQPLQDLINYVEKKEQ